MKTCKTCKWFQQNDGKDSYGTCFQSAPPWTVDSNEQGPDIATHHRCSKWESKLERKCGNCEFFRPWMEKPNMGNCLLNPPIVLADGETRWPELDVFKFCGEFRGKE